MFTVAITNVNNQQIDYKNNEEVNSFEQYQTRNQYVKNYRITSFLSHFSYLQQILQIHFGEEKKR